MWLPGPIQLTMFPKFNNICGNGCPGTLTEANESRQHLKSGKAELQTAISAKNWPMHYGPPGPLPHTMSSKFNNIRGDGNPRKSTEAHGI